MQRQSQQSRNESRRLRWTRGTSWWNCKSSSYSLPPKHRYKREEETDVQQHWCSLATVTTEEQDAGTALRTDDSPGIRTQRTAVRQRVSNFLKTRSQYLQENLWTRQPDSELPCLGRRSHLPRQTAALRASPGLGDGTPVLGFALALPLSPAPC